MYRHAEPTVHTVSPRGRRLILGEAAVAVIITLFPVALGVAAMCDPPPVRAVVPLMLAFAAASAWGLVRPQLLALTTRLELHPGGAAVLTQWGKRVQLHAGAVREVRREPSVARAVCLVDGQGRPLMAFPAELLGYEAVDAWLEAHIGGRARDADSAECAARFAAWRRRLADEGLTERDARRFWSRFTKVAVVAALAGAPAFASWVAGPSWNRAGVALLAACAACAGWMLVRHRTLASFGVDRRAGLLVLAAVPVLGLAMNACLNLRATLDRPRLALVSVPIAGVLALALLPLLRTRDPALRGMRRAMAACVVLLAPSLAQLADTLFDPFPPVTTQARGVMGREGSGRNRALFVTFSFEGRERQTPFAPPFRAGFHAESGAPVNVTVGRGLLGVPYAREVGPGSPSKH